MNEKDVVVIHSLKILEKFGYDILDGNKTFEIRQNDRGFQKGDYVVFDPVDKYGVTNTSHPIKLKRYQITYVLSGWGLKDGYVVFGIKECE